MWEKAMNPRLLKRLKLGWGFGIFPLWAGIKSFFILEFCQLDMAGGHRQGRGPWEAQRK